MTVTYTAEGEQNVLFYKINFSDDKIPLFAKLVEIKNNHSNTEDCKPLKNEFKDYEFYKSFTLNIPGMNLSYLNIYKVFNLV